MHYQECKPHPQLRDWIKCYWFLEKDYDPLLDFEAVLPDGCLDLIIHFGARFSAGTVPDCPTGFLIGPLRHQLTLRATGRVITYGIRFYPYGLSPFLPIPVQEFADQLIDIIDIFGAAGAELVSQLAASRGASGFEVLERFLIRQRHEKRSDTALIQSASQSLYDQHGAVSIAQLAASVFLSERSLERKFLLTTGFTPKGLARIMRFNHIKNELILHPHQRLTDLAAQALYFDQAHFIHDFEQFTGISPLAFTHKVESGVFRFYK